MHWTPYISDFCCFHSQKWIDSRFEWNPNPYLDSRLRDDGVPKGGTLDLHQSISDINYLPMLLLPPPTLFIAFARTWWNVASDHKLGSLIMPILGIWMHLMESAYPVLLLWCASKLWAPYWKEVVPKFAGLHIASAHLCTWCLWKVKFAREGTIGPHQAA